MNCAEIQNSLVEYLLNELSASEKATIEDHLASECAACQSELQELSESIGMLWKALPSHPLPTPQREQIVTACLAKPCHSKLTRNVVTSASSTQSKSLTSSWLEPLLALVAGVLVMAALRVAFTKPTVSQTGVAIVAPSTQTNAGSFGTQQTPDSLEMSAPRYKKTQFVSLHRSTKSHELSGQLLWDRLNREVHVYCFGLTQPQAGCQYTLWLVGPSKTVRILDELKIDPSGECSAVASWPIGNFQFIQVALSRNVELDSLTSSEVILTSDSLQSNGF